MKIKPWLRTTLIQVAAFILITGVLDRFILPEAFDLRRFMVKTLFGGVIFGAVLGYANYKNYKNSLK